MILRVGSTSEKFREVRFKSGLNIVLAKRAEESSDKASTNATGKTALLEVIHFCLGAELAPLKTLSKENLKDQAFFMSFTVLGRELSVRRGLDLPRMVRVQGLTPEEDALVTVKSRIEDAAVISIDDWRILLGRWFFDIGVFGNENAPSFRSLFAYFARYPEPAYLSAKSTVPREKESAAERKYAYLLHLNWLLVDEAIALRSEADKLVQDENGFRQLARRLGAEGESESELASDLNFKRAEVARAASEARAALANFRVLPEYEQMEDEANTLAAEMQQLRRDLLVRSRILEDYQSSAREADDIAPHAVTELYQAAGIELPSAVIRSLEEVVEFHKSLVIERQTFLAREMSRLYRELEDIRSDLARLDEQKSAILRVLQGAKALPEYSQLSSRANELQARSQQLDQGRSIYDDILKRRAALNTRRAELLNRFTIYDLENQAHYSSLISAYSSMSAELHETSAQLVIRTDFPRKQGLPKFFLEVKIDGKGATGRVRCEILLFDLLLATLWSRTKPDTMILVHDSIMFDAMDPRQRAHSLLLAKRVCAQSKFQYIALLNESEWPVDLLNELDPEGSHSSDVCHTLDDSESGGLFGFRFDDYRFAEAAPDEPSEEERPGFEAESSDGDQMTADAERVEADPFDAE